MSNAINVLITRNKNGETVENVAAAPIVKPEELRATGNALDNLTRNVLAGKVGATIRKAADNGKLADILPGDQLKNQRSALAFLMTVKPADVRKAWAEYCKGRERVTAPTLQRLAKECKPKPEPKEPRVTVKQIVELWESMPQEWREDKRAIDFHDLMVSAAPAEPSH